MDAINTGIRALGAKPWEMVYGGCQLETRNPNRGEVKGDVNSIIIGSR